MIQPDSDSIARRLANSGLRSTPQREVVYGILLSERNHPTAEELFTRVKTQLPGTSLATVYNCLEVLVSSGLVKQVNLERGPSRYCPNLHEHAHLHNEATGEVFDIDLPADLIGRLRELLPSELRDSVIELNFHAPKRTALAAPARS